MTAIDIYVRMNNNLQDVHILVEDYGMLLYTAKEALPVQLTDVY